MDDRTPATRRRALRLIRGGQPPPVHDPERTEPRPPRSRAPAPAPPRWPPRPTFAPTPLPPSALPFRRLADARPLHVVLDRRLIPGLHGVRVDVDETISPHLRAATLTLPRGLSVLETGHELWFIIDDGLWHCSALGGHLLRISPWPATN